MIDLGNFVAGHEAGMDRQNKQEMLKMQKQQYYYTKRINEQTIEQNDYALQQLQEVQNAQKRLKADYERDLVDDVLSKGFNAGTKKDLDKAVETLNGLSIMKGKTVNGMSSENPSDMTDAIKYIQAKGYNTKPYIVDENGKKRAPNELDQAEIQEARTNAINDDTAIATEFLNNARLLKNSDGQVVGLEDIAAVTGHFQRRHSSQIVNDEILAGIRSKLTASSGATKPTFASMVADFVVSNPNATPEQISTYSQSIQGKSSNTDKLPTEASMIASYIKSNPNATLGDINTFVKTLKGKLFDVPTGPKEPATSTSTYRDMVSTSGQYGIDWNSNNAIGKFEKLSTTQQGDLKAKAKEYFKESKEDLMKNTTLAKHLHTISNLAVDPSTMSADVKEAAGLGDNALNMMTQYFTTNNGIEFKKKFQQTFNSLFTTTSGNQRSNAELENLKEAFDGLNKSNDVVFSNFKSMVVALKSQLDATVVTAPVAARILYGKQITAYEQLVDTLNKVDGSQTSTITTNDGTTVPTLDFGGAQ